MKLCVVGNSHAAALKGALDADGGGASVDLSFYVMPGGAGPNLRIDGKRLLPAPLNKDKVFSTVPGAGTHGLDLSLFDVVVVCAVGLPAHRNGDAAHILNRLALGSLIQNASVDRQIVSEAVMASEMENVLRASANQQTIQLIRSVFSGRIIVQVCPLPTRAISAYKVTSERGSDLATQYGDNVWTFLGWYYRTQISLITTCAGPLDAHVLAPQPAFIEAGQTPSKFGTPDPWHMNTAYGRLVLKQVCAALGQPIGPAV